MAYLVFNNKHAEVRPHSPFTIEYRKINLRGMSFFDMSGRYERQYFPANAGMEIAVL
jgi:hypothetical protein